MMIEVDIVKLVVVPSLILDGETFTLIFGVEADPHASRDGLARPIAVHGAKHRRDYSPRLDDDRLGDQHGRGWRHAGHLDEIPLADSGFNCTALPNERRALSALFCRA